MNNGPDDIPKTFLSEVVVEVGRVTGGGTFVTVRHVPSGKERTRMRIGRKTTHEVTLELARDLWTELAKEHGGERERDA